MKAALVDRYGPPDAVRVDDVPQPTPRAGEVLVRVRSAAVTSGDARLRAARFPSGFGMLGRLGVGFRGPRRPILGVVFSGEVVAVGPRGGEFVIDDEVCGMTGPRFGAHAEYVAVPAKRLVRKPAEVSHDNAAAMLFGGTTAWYFLRDRAGVGAGTSVLIVGASGAVGTNAVQLAKHLGADVTAVTSRANIALVETLGADAVVDYTETSLDTWSERYDVVMDTVGVLTPTTGRRLLAPGGRLLLVSGDLWAALNPRRDVVAGMAPERTENVVDLLTLMTQGRLEAVIDESMELDQIAAAYERVDSGHKVGNIVVHP